MEVNMEMEMFVLLTTLIPIALTTALSIVIVVALCYFYRKVHKDEIIEDGLSSNGNPGLGTNGSINPRGTSGQHSALPQQVQAHPYCITPVAVPTGTTIPIHYHEAPITYPLPSRPFSSYDTVCSMNVSGHPRKSSSTVRGYLSVSSSSLSSTGRYYAGERAVPWQTSNSDLYNYSVVSSLSISPEYVGTHRQVQRIMVDAHNSTFSNGKVRREQLPILAPLHSYTSPEKTTVQYESEYLDIANMDVSP